MKRGDIVVVSTPGDYGKPRPAVIVQSDGLSNIDSILVSLITSANPDLSLFRLTLEPLPSNGLKMKSQVMVDKIMVIPRAKCGKVIGQLDDGSIVALNSMISFVFGLAD